MCAGPKTYSNGGFLLLDRTVKVPNVAVDLGVQWLGKVSYST